MNIAEKIKNAGIVGAGGAGFPTHVKVNCKADVVIANGAECEPILKVDQLVMNKFASEIVDGMVAVMEQTGADEGVICLKKHYHEAVKALNGEMKRKSNIRLMLFDSFYPAGDEQQMVYEVTGKVVPTGGLPLDVGAVVLNVSTLVNVANALRDIPVVDKYVTLGGEIEKPITIKAPIGTPISELIKAAGGPINAKGYTVVIGGPCMGRSTKDWNEPVTKTMGGIIVLKDEHPLLERKEDDVAKDIKLAKAVCCQCSLCTQMCPRNSLGLNVLPHKAMRAAANGDGKLLGDINGIFSCCDCGLCTYYACNFGLNPSKMMTRMKNGLAQAGVKPRKEVFRKTDTNIDLKKVPVSRLMSRLGVKKYDKETPLIDENFPIDMVKIPLRMHIGMPAEPTVGKGDKVKVGDLIGEIPKDKLGAKVHASINGTINEITDSYIEIAL
jgi:Na+-translocating ferredoxin:NAD+ oxidoreductase RnfC subunit